MPIDDGDRILHYKIHSKIGAGGMGEVYLATDTRLDRKVALKILPEEVTSDLGRVRRFLREAKAASSLNHPHIITIHEIGQANSIHFIATEFINGKTLRDSIKREQIQISTAVEIAIQISLALVAAHQVKIIHRDLKPENIMVRDDGFVKLLDFGLAKLLQQDGANPEASTLLNTAAGIVLGTLSYMSPEQARGLAVDARTDIWSLGVILYEMLTGRRPFEGTTMSDVLAAVLDHEPAPLARYSPAVPPSLERITRKALSKNPDERYQTAKGLLIDLKTVRRELDQEKFITETPPAAQKVLDSSPSRSTRKNVLGGAAVLLLLVGLLAFFFRHRLWTTQQVSNEPVTLAILPFEPLNPSEDIGFLTTGLADSIITRLANVHQIRVRPTRAILGYEGKKVSAQLAGRELGCEYVVLGTLQEIGDHLQVKVQLIRAADEVSIWGNEFNKERSDLLNLQNALAAQIAEALRIKMTATEQARVYRRYTDNARAFELYLLGRSKLSRHTKDDTLTAIKAFEDALRLDANYALAHAGLAEASAVMRIRFATEKEVEDLEERAKNAANRALDLDPNLAEAHEALAAVYRNSEFNWEQTIAESDRALLLNPNLDQPHYYRAVAFYHLGLLESVESDITKALRNNPFNNAEALRARGITALLAGRHSEAVALLEEARRMSSAPVTDWYLSQAYYYHGAPEQAEQILTKLRGSAQAEQRAKATLASFLAARNEKQRSQELLSEVFAGSYRDHHVDYSVGATYAQLGDLSQSRRWLARAIATGFPCYPWFQRDQLLRPLVGDAEYQVMLDQLKKHWDSNRAKYK
ncbi:MAG: protein kinase [Acidobacteria bacterium]|nr:protein kinase [Acidobacteriota bacterium]MCA1627097.1 protein kinase [Acidobacteriota bacterium]